MREIKFRGKILKVIKKHHPCKVGEWAYGDLLHAEHDFVKGVDIITDDFSQVVVDENTVGQYTGLKDKNGREIYEGDIVKYLAEGFSTGRIGYIAFLAQECGFVIVLPKSDSRLGQRNRGGGYDCDPTLEVIGNVYDDKELLKQ